MDESVRLIWDAEIHTQARTFPISLRFPNHFPHSPPLVLPRGDTQLWSSHQYGPGGELCLEYGTDNWHSGITGADMIASAHRLLQAEAIGSDEPEAIASRDRTTLGQNLRGHLARFLVTRSLSEFATSISEGIVLSGVVVVQFREGAFTNVLTSVHLPEGKKWSEPVYPKPLEFEGYEQTAAFFRWPGGKAAPPAKSFTELKAAAASIGLEILDVRKIILVQGISFKAYTIGDDDTVIEQAVIREPAAVDRLDEGHKKLRDRKVSLIGCGSLGSKIATMLARSGVGKFLLVDDDILLPDNLVRHDLDWREVGTHKADSVARRIQMVNPAAVCERRRHRLGGQESSGAVEALIEILTGSDLIIDCTADASAFNYLCAAVAVAKKSLLWAEVFGGGFGGLIARSRFQLDPDPATIRRLIDNWCAQQGKPLPTPTIDYARASDTPQIADDADVTVIAAYAARMAIDVLIPREPSAYSQSAYVIGLAKEWIFEGVFETYPIDVGPPLASPSESALDPEEAKVEFLKIVELLTEHKNEDSSGGSSS
jgi:molybdopterin/thiamine biosynthesis adenylyltransferase